MNLRDLKTVTIKPGTFLLGSQIQREPRTKVIITRGFDMLTTPVTQELFLKVMGENPSAHQGAAGATTADEDNTSDNLASMRAGTFRLTGDNALCRPVENVSWLDAIRFCNTLSKLSGLTPAYTIDGENVSWPDKECDGWRLPTYCEAEYACKAGTTTDFFFGNALHTPENTPDVRTRLGAPDPRLADYAWYGHNAHAGQTNKYGRWITFTMPVGLKLPNPWGLYDIIGNVKEWVWDLAKRHPKFLVDVKNQNYKTALEVSDPDEPSLTPWENKDRKARAFKGAAYHSIASENHSADDSSDGSSSAAPDIGFRVVRTNALRMKDPHAPYRLTLQGGEPPGWRTTSHPTEQLIHHLSLQLVDGSILVFTGNKAEVFDPHSELWQRTEEPKHRHGAGTQALTLRNERVIVVSRGLSEPQSQCEFYYADQRQWKKLIDGPKVARAYGQLTELHDGRVLASGGALFGKSPTELAPHASCELFDPKTFVWTEVEPMNHPRFGHQAVALQDGSILVVGGQTTSIERWHPESGWDEVGALPGPLYGHQILLVDEHVFIVGGTDAEPMNLGDARITYNSSYLVDTSTYAIEEVADMRMPRHGFSLLRLANGDVLALGGYDGFNALTSCELWDLDSQIWRDGPSLNHPKHDHTALVMSDNRVLIIDAGHTEVWNPHAKTAGTDLSP